MAVGIYLRVSTEEQRERQSIATQRELTERHCSLHDLSVYKVYADDGVPGTIPLGLRPDGSQMLRDARLKKFDQLLVYRLDRLGRETSLILEAVAELKRCGVRVQSMTESLDNETSSGRLMITLLSGFATDEREVIRERSLSGTDRRARAGAWMGGVVPYGYYKLGQKGDARLILSEDLIPGLGISETEIVRTIYRMAAAEKKSCVAIAEHLNRIGAPCAYVRDDRMVSRGKRKQRTSGIWRPGRVRNLLVSTTYMGRHEYGKRSRDPSREVITRVVPAMVTEEVWRKAQATLKANFLFGIRSSRNQYLLRGLIKCGLCGLTYVGVAANRPNGKRESYYKCNGAHTPSVYSAGGRCQSKAVRGDLLEQQVWADVETFLRNPEPVLQQLQARLQSDVQGSGEIRKQVTRLEALLAQKTTERNRVVSLYRRGRLTDVDLDAQMDEIGREETALQAQLTELSGRITGTDSIGAILNSAENLLVRLRKRLDAPLSFEMKRRIVEVLVSGIRVDTVENCGVKESKITVIYRFSQPGEPMPVVLPQSYSAGSVIRIPTEPHTVGDHLRKRRLALKLLQRHVAEQIGVDKTSVHNWETNASAPEIRYMPAVIQFLGYNPLPEAKTLADQLVRHRTTLGLMQKETAQRLGVDQGTLARWERGEREPTGKFLDRVNEFLNRGVDIGSSDARRAGYVL